MTFKPGDQLAATTSSTRVVVLRAPAGAEIACGGTPMVPAADVPAAPQSGTDALIGKRYVDAADTVELLCTASGTGALSCNGEELTIKAAKPLPASD